MSKKPIGVWADALIISGPRKLSYFIYWLGTGDSSQDAKIVDEMVAHDKVAGKVFVYW